MYFISKSKKALKEGGINLLITRFYRFSSNKVRWGVIRLLRPWIIKEIKSFHSDKGEDILTFFESSRYGSYIKPMQVESEFLRLLEYIKDRKPKVILEIGTANGGTLFGFSKLAPNDALIISIDLPHGSFGGGYPKSKIPLYSSFKKEGQEIILLREDSHSQKTLEKVKEILKGRTIDFLFIDGDHTYEGVKKDFELYRSLVNNKGIIAFHDIAVHPKELGCVVNLYWDEIKKRYVYEELIEDRNQGWAGIGILFTAL